MSSQLKNQETERSLEVRPGGKVANAFANYPFVAGGKFRTSLNDIWNRSLINVSLNLGFVLCILIALKGIHGFKRRDPGISGSQYFQRWRVASSTPVILGSLVQGLTDSPRKRADREKRKASRQAYYQ